MTGSQDKLDALQTMYRGILVRETRHPWVTFEEQRMRAKVAKEKRRMDYAAKHGVAPIYPKRKAPDA